MGTISTLVLVRKEIPTTTQPWELRNQIHACVVTEDYHLKGLRRPKKTKSIFQHSCKHRASLLYVCRQIYTKTALLPFQLNTWRFTSYVGIEVLHARLTAQQCRAIRSVCMHLKLNDHPNSRDTRSALIQRGAGNLVDLLPGLRSVGLEEYMKQLKAWMSGGGRQMKVYMDHYFGWRPPYLER
ncbi:predicted protein [Plenodomus lingam JN3]|uniref:Predicted protein n=1 Tax=Leptosphaeria maculans (strain JN3 / isolate v23.1.3 / race Av1-4-5-6-7-8) TaxID=985895 RepID=E4ZXB0_LEPMJ|nr:predicted protein [Plenodomus lingam JN3]CBX95320.1 predicted protein [Plenodomus lingam JN3]